MKQLKQTSMSSHPTWTVFKANFLPSSAADDRNRLRLPPAVSAAARARAATREGGTGTGGVRRVDGVDVAPRSVVLLKERGAGKGKGSIHK